MTRALERHEAGSARVIPVLLRDCDWHPLPFGKLIAVPKDGKAVTLWNDVDEAFADVAREIRRVVEGMGAAKGVSTNAAVARTSEPQPAKPVLPTGPRSSNLLVRQEFTDHERDEFLREGFEYAARFFQNSLEELAKRHPNLKSVFTRTDAVHFSVVVYRSGKSEAECSVRIDGFGNRASGLAYSAHPNTRSGSYNEMLTVEADSQKLYFKPMGWGFNRSAATESRLTPHGASEYLWDLLMGPLQRPSLS